MEGIVVGIVVHYLVGELADGAAKFDVKAFETKAHAAVASAVHSQFADEQIDKAVDSTVEAIQKLFQEKPELTAVLSDLAQKDLGAAKAAAIALLKPVVTGEFAALLAAA